MPDWPEIIEREGGAVWRTAYRLLGNRADADECFQEAFLAALGVARREPVRDWGALLRRLAASRAIDRLRQRYRHGDDRPMADWDALPCPSPLPSRGVEDAELTESLRAALACLPPKQAEAFCLHHLEDWSYREIAGHLAISVDAVGVLLHRARKRLRELLESSSEVPRVAGRGPAPRPGPIDLTEEPR
jgi:RNA polymerase sigma-70 factor, ECF subfamily